MRNAEAGKRVGAHVGAVQIERIARRDGVADGDGNGESPPLGEEAVEAHGPGDAGGVVGDVRGILAELAELSIAPRHAHGQVADVRGRETQIQRARDADVLHDVAQPDVVHPQLRLIHEDEVVDPPDPGGDLLDAGEVRRGGARIADVHDVVAVAHDVRGVGNQECGVGAPGVDLRAVAAQPRLLDQRPKAQPGREVHYDLGLPGDRAGRRMV